MLIRRKSATERQTSCGDIDPDDLPSQVSVSRLDRSANETFGFNGWSRWTETNGFAEQTSGFQIRP
ncbi:hypothetical protein CPJ18_11125 [Agrobacterium rosae]|uniref:Uncharacterized protein n=1 Tax=Agrobacterium rosae TaxID=1972867 RepID=A0AAE5RWP3_9HYPH|nr:hypothetical protein CPJ18_11125 [Agrobacterium rosae]